MNDSPSLNLRRTGALGLSTINYPPSTDLTLFISLETGLREIFSHKFRSFLSMLGIVLGVGSLIATMALTGGMERGMRAFMEQVGGLETVNVVTKEISNDLMGFYDLSPGRTLQDAYAIRESAPLISQVSPQLEDGMPVSAGGEIMRDGRMARLSRSREA